MAIKRSKETVTQTVRTAHEHIVWLYAEIERLQHRVAKLEGQPKPPWQGPGDADDEGPQWTVTKLELEKDLDED